MNNYVGGGKARKRSCVVDVRDSDGWGAARHMQGTTGAQGRTTGAARLRVAAAAAADSLQARAELGRLVELVA